MEVRTARNQGYLNSSGEIVLFIDDDVVPVPKLITAHLRFHEQFGAQIVVIGPMVSPPDFEMSPWVFWEQSMLAEQYSQVSAGRMQMTARSFFYRQHFPGPPSSDRQRWFRPDFSTGRGRRTWLPPEFIRPAIFVQFGCHWLSLCRTPLFIWLKDPLYVRAERRPILTYEKGQGWLLPMVWSEFLSRHALNQALVHLCLGRPLVGYTGHQPVEGPGHAWPPGKVGRRCSSWPAAECCTKRYYQGIAQKIGGRKAFFAGVAGSRPGWPIIAGRKLWRLTAREHSWKIPLFPGPVLRRNR